MRKTQPLPTPPGADLSRQGTIDQEYRFPGFVVPKPVAESQPPPAESPQKLMIANADSLKRHGAVHGKTEEGEGAEKVGGTESPVVEEWVEVPTPKIVVKPPTADPIATSTATPLSPTSSSAYPIPHGLESEGPTPSSTAATRQTGASALSSIWSNVSSAIPPVKVKHDQRLMVASLALIALESLTNVALLISIMVVHSWIINWLPTFASKASPSSATAWFDVLVAFQTLMVYHGLLLAAQIMQLWLLTDSITSTNTLELLGFFAFQFCSFVYTVVQVFQEQYLDRLIIAAWPVSYEGSAGAEVYRTHTNLAWGLMAVNASFVVCWVGLSWKMYKDWGWRKYRRVGADMAVRRRVWWHQSYMLLLKLDLFFFIGFACQYITMTAGNFYYNPSTGYVAGLSIAASLIVLLFMIVGHFAARLQSAVLMVVFLGGLLAGIGFDCWLFWLIFASPSAYIYEAARAGMSVFMALALLFAVLTLIVALVNLVFFVRGPRLLYKELRLDVGERKDSEADLQRKVFVKNTLGSFFVPAVLKIDAVVGRSKGSAKAVALAREKAGITNIAALAKKLRGSDDKIDEAAEDLPLMPGRFGGSGFKVPHICGACEKTPKEGQKFKQCSRCKITAYCSAECQRLDWKNHKVKCRHLDDKGQPLDPNADPIDATILAAQHGISELVFSAERR